MGAFPLSLRNVVSVGYIDELASNSRIEDSERVLKVNIFYRTIDVALTRIEVRFKGMQMVAEKFDFLFPRNFVK